MNDLAEIECGIRQLQARYGDAVWRKDFAAFADCFAAQAEWHIAGQVIRGRDECAALLERIMPDIERV